MGAQPVRSVLHKGRKGPLAVGYVEHPRAEPLAVMVPKLKPSQMLALWAKIAERNPKLNRALLL